MDNVDRLRLTRRHWLSVLAGASACACCSNAFARRLNYDLAATEIASKTWAVHGASEYFNFDNGGNIVNVAFIETAEGVRNLTYRKPSLANEGEEEKRMYRHYS